MLAEARRLRLAGLACERDGLTKAPALAALGKLERLSLAHNGLTALPAEVGKLAALADLDVSDNKLTAVDPTVLAAPKLQRLDLARNPIRALPGIEASASLREVDVTDVPLTAAEVVRLRALEASGSSIRFVGLGAPMTSLEAALADPEAAFALDLSGSSLRSIPPAIAKLTHLRELVLDGLRLSRLPRELAKLQQLRVLSLRDNAFTALPAEVVALRALRELRLDGNRISALPDGVAQLAELERLSIDDNRIASLPGALGELQALRELSAARNNLTTLPAELAGLTALRVLDVDDNQITTIPPELGQLAALRELWLWGNQVTGMPPELAQLPELELLELRANPLATPLTGRLARVAWWDGQPAQLGGQSRYFATLDGNELPEVIDPDVRTLRIEGATVFPHEALVGLRRLRGLTLVGYSSDYEDDRDPDRFLDELPASIAELRALAELDVSSNRLRTLPSSLGKLAHLRSISISNNRFETIPPLLYRLPDTSYVWQAGKTTGMMRRLSPVLRFELPDRKPAVVVAARYIAKRDRDAACQRELVELQLVALAKGAPPLQLASVDPCAGTATVLGDPVKLTGIELPPSPRWSELVTWQEAGRAITLTLPNATPRTIRWNDHGAADAEP